MDFVRRFRTVAEYGFFAEQSNQRSAEIQGVLLGATRRACSKRSDFPSGSPESGICGMHRNRGWIYIRSIGTLRY